MSDKALGELIEDIGKRPAYGTSTYGRDEETKKRARYDEAVKEIHHRVRDAEWARADAEGYRERMVEQARRIAELEADVARLTRAEEIKPAVHERSSSSKGTNA